MTPLRLVPIAQRTVPMGQRILSLLLLAGTAGTVACGSNDRPDSSDAMGGHTVATSGGSGSSSDVPLTDDVATGDCESDESRDCRVWLPEVNGTKNCFVGTQVCVDATWSSCLTDEDAAALLDD